MPFPYPMRLLDRSGRSLHWVMILKGKAWHTNQTVHYSPECLIEICPREAEGQPYDILSRPCHSDQNLSFRLKDEVHGWLEEQDTYYQLEYRFLDMQDGWCVGFLDPKHAVHFKLRWGSL